jgi:hypothetical protein
VSDPLAMPVGHVVADEVRADIGRILAGNRQATETAETDALVDFEGEAALPRTEPHGIASDL